MKSTTVLLGNRAITIYHEDDRFIREVLQEGEYKDVFDDLVVIDIGANIGTFSFWIYDHARIIYAIEPSIENIKYMNQTKEFNELDKIHTFPLAISGTGGLREMDTEQPAAGGSWRLTNGTFHKSMVITQTLTEFMNSQNIEYVDILKIDVEGAEYEIFDSSSFIVEAPKIKTIIGEYHGPCPTKILEKNGYVVRNIVEKSKFVARRK